MRTTQLAEKLTKSLGKAYVVVTNPDHPYLFTPPDLLIGGEGRLFAIFIPKRSEIYSPNNLLARLAVCRLAFQSHMKCLFFLTDLASEKYFLQAIERYFEAIISYKDESVLIDIIKSDTEHMRIEPISENLRQRAYLRCQFLIVETERRSKKKYEDIRPQNILKEFSRKEEYWTAQYSLNIISDSREYETSRPRIFVQHRNHVFSVAEFKPRTSPLPKLKHRSLSSIQLNYSFDRGIPYPTSPRVTYLIVNRVPIMRYDPWKPVRASAFAGLVLTQADSPQDLEKAAIEMEYNLEKRQLL